MPVAAEPGPRRRATIARQPGSHRSSPLGPFTPPDECAVAEALGCLAPADDYVVAKALTRCVPASGANAIASKRRDFRAVPARTATRSVSGHARPSGRTARPVPGWDEVAYGLAQSRPVVTLGPWVCLMKMGRLVILG